MAKPYIRNPLTNDVYDQQGRVVSAEMASKIPDFWNQVDVSTFAPATGGNVSNYQELINAGAQNTGVMPEVNTNTDLLNTNDSTGADTYKDFMKTWLEGYGKKQEQLSGVQKQISDVENLLGSLEKDIKSRTQDYLVTQAQRNRQIASEGAPLREQYAGLLKGQSAVEAGLAGERSMLPYYKEMMTYQSPQEEYAQTMKEYEDKLKLERQYQEPDKPATTADITEYEYYKKQGGTKTFEQFTASGKTTPTPPTPTETIDVNSLQTYLQNQGLAMPTSIITTKGVLTSAAKNRAIAAGVPTDIIDFLWNNMQAGNTFEEIRQGMRSEGLDTGLLDKFVQALQNKKGGEEPDF